MLLCFFIFSFSFLPFVWTLLLPAPHMAPTRFGFPGSRSLRSMGYAAYAWALSLIHISCCKHAVLDGDLSIYKCLVFCKYFYIFYNHISTSCCLFKHIPALCPAFLECPQCIVMKDFFLILILLQMCIRDRPCAPASKPLCRMSLPSISSN